MNVLPLLAGVAVADMVAALLPGEAPMLKWPNDVLLGGGKLAGILIDAAPCGKELDWVVIGIGVNLAYAPEIPGKKTECLGHHGVTAGPEAVAARLLDRLSFWLDEQARNGAAILDAWQHRAHVPGTSLSVEMAGVTVNGTYAGISRSGELLLHVEDRIERFQTGEIFLRAKG